MLEYLNKGFSTEMTREQCPRLNAAGIRHIDLVMLGTGGKGRGSKPPRQSLRWKTKSNLRDSM